MGIREHSLSLSAATEAAIDKSGHGSGHNLRSGPERLGPVRLTSYRAQSGILLGSPDLELRYY